MKFIKEWKSFLNEQNFLKGYPLDINEDGEVVLYHVSSHNNIQRFEPEVASKSAKNYTTRDYVTWNRPRVFFFTKLSQEDTGIGRIPGSNYYKVEVPMDKLYPVMKDPANLSSKLEIQNYMIQNIDGFEERFKKAEKCEAGVEYNQWHICTKNIDSDGLAWYEERFMGKKFLIDDPRLHSQKPNVYEMVANLAEKRYGSIGFIYPQEAGNQNTLIATIWRPVNALKLNNYYQEI
jgi:hypothetical protein